MLVSYTIKQVLNFDNVSIPYNQGRQSINEMATVIQRAWRLYKIRKDEKEKKEKFSTMKKLSTLPVTPATPPSQTATSVRRSRSFGFFNLILMDFIGNSQVIGEI